MRGTSALLLILSLACSLAVLAWACGSTSAPSTVSRITVTGTAPANGLTAQFTATAASSNGASQDVTAQASWQTSNPAVATISPTGLVTGVSVGGVTISATYQGASGSVPVSIANPACDPTLWNHMHDPKRLTIVQPCMTVTGVIMDHFNSDDGDVDMGLAVDAPFGNLLNNGNLTKLSGHLQTEAICQVPVHPDVPDAIRSCQNFVGTVPLPPVGTHVQVTGTYTLDMDHGWMEIHPITVMIVR